MKQQSLNQPEIPQEQKKILYKEPSPSEYLNQYLQYFGYSDVTQYHQLKTHVLQSPQFQEGFEFKNTLAQLFYLKMIAHSPDKEFVEIQAIFGNFTLSIIIALFEGQSHTHKVSENYSGNFCVTYRPKCFGKYSAIKCFSLISKNQHLLNDNQIRRMKVGLIRNAIKEYCITWIASKFKIGPKIEKRLGYDIALYKNCLEFEMEFCFQMKNIPQYVDYEGQVRTALKTAHSLRLIHYDIKPQNICYSSKYQRIIFIDFGLSEFSYAELGEMQEMHFKGSLSYVSKQMVKLFNKDEYDWVDPYYNDLHCLKKSVEQFQRFKLQRKQKIEDQNHRDQCKYDNIENAQLADVTKYHLVKKLKFFLFQSRKQQFLKLWTNSEYLKMVRSAKREVLDFIFSLKYTQFFSQFETIFDSHDQMQEAISVQNSLQSFKFYEKFSQLKDTKQSQINETFSNLIEVTSFKYNCSLFQKTFENETEYLLKAHQISTLTVIPKEEYFICLANALRINTNNYSFELRKKFASVALNYFFIQKNLKQNSRNNKQLKSAEAEIGLNALKLVSRHLLEYSLSQPQSNAKFQIYAAIVLNVVILKAASQQQLFNYYVKLHSLKIDFQIKLRMVLKFVSSYEWMAYTIKSKQNYQKQKKKYRDFSAGFLEKLKNSDQKDQKLQLYWIITQVSHNNAYLFLLYRLPQIEHYYKKCMLNKMDQYHLKSNKLKIQLQRWIEYIKVSSSLLRGDNYYYFLLTRKYFLEFQKQFDYFLFVGMAVHKKFGLSQKLKKFFESIFSQTTIFKDYCFSSLSDIIHGLNVPQNQLTKNIPLLMQRIPQSENNNWNYVIQLNNLIIMGKSQSFKTYLFLTKLLFQNVLDTNYTDIYHFYNKKILGYFFFDDYSINLRKIPLQNSTFNMNKQVINYFLPIYKAQKMFQNKHKQQIKTINHITLKFLSLNQINTVFKLQSNKQSKRRIIQLSSIIARVVYTFRKSILKNLSILGFRLTQNNICIANLPSFKVDENYILFYNIFLQNCSKNLQIFIDNELFIKLLFLVQRLEGVQKMVNFYLKHIQKYLQLRVVQGQVVNICLLCLYLVKTISKNLQKKKRFLNKVEKQIQSNSSLYLLAFMFFNQLSLSKNSLSCMRLFKGLQNIPILLRKILFRFLYFQFHLKYDKYLPMRKRERLAKINIIYHIQQRGEMPNNTTGLWKIRNQYSINLPQYWRFIDFLKQKYIKLISKENILTQNLYL